MNLIVPINSRFQSLFRSIVIATVMLVATLAHAQDVTVPGPAGCNAAAQAGVFEIPCGVTNVTVQLYGGGGGAGGGGGGSNGGLFNTRGGGGGGGGGFTTITVDVTPGSMFNYSIGAGGCGGDGNGDGSSGDPGTNGGNTTITGTDALGNPINLAANGGIRGTGGSGTEGSAGSGGAGGTASGGSTNTNGSAGSNGSGGTGGVGGAAGGGPAGGPGGAADGGNGSPFGGGGGGGEDSDGGNGAPGAILITFNSQSNQPPGPTITAGAPTCTMDGTSTIDNYDPTETYTFNPPGPTVGAGGLISGMTTGTSYTVIAGDITCPTLPSAPFSNAAATGQLVSPTISSTPASCTAAGSSTISNYNAALTYTFNPVGPTVGAGGAINGMVAGTSYTVIANEGANCISPASASFSNDAQLTGPTVSISGALSHCPGGNTTVTASGGTTYAWSSGDNTAAATLVAGNYTVTVTDAQGCSTTENVVITLSDIPVADFTVVDACMGQDVEFYDASTIATGTITGWDWDFGDGSSSTLQDPTHAYATAGTFNVTLTVSAGNCSDQVTYTANAFASPVADFSTANVCVGNAAQFTDNSSAPGGTVVMWAWDFDGLANALTQNTSYTFPNAGTYDVTLLIATADLCSDSYTTQVTVYPAPVAAFTATEVCEGTPTVFQNTSSITTGTIVGSAWDFGDGSATSTASAPSHTFSTAGTYAVTLGVISANGCPALTVQNVTINPLPTISATSTDILCAGQTNGTATASVVGGSAPYTYQWSDLFQSTTSSITGLSQGNYMVTVTDGNGCKDDTTVAVIQPAPIVVQLTAWDDTCGWGNGAIQAVMLGGTGPYDYAWSSIANSASVFSEDVTPSGWNTNLSAGDYSVVVTDAGGCQTSGEASVGLIAPPIAAFTTRSFAEELTDATVVFDNESQNAVSYEWHFGNEDVSYEENPVYDYGIGGVYLVMLIAENDPRYGCTDTTFGYVEVAPFVTFYVPNAFTPDGDGKNDTWEPKGTNFEYESYNMQVFDRWGKLIWQTDNPNKYWDGNDPSTLEEVKQGMYVYQASIHHFNTFEPKIINGTVMLYRHN